MNELSLHILDVVQNSIKANATLIKIIINDDIVNNTYTITIEDNGHGMNAQTLSKVSDPFFTSRTTRKVGLGISLFKMACEMTEGTFTINSEEHKGTSVKAVFTNDHIDRAPLGDMEETLAILILNEQNIDIYYEHNINDRQYIFNTIEIKEILDGIPLHNFEVITWIKQNIKDGINTLKEEQKWNL